MIDSTQFGEIVIDNKKYHQVLMIGDSVEERDYEKLQELFKTSHKIGDWEMEKLSGNNPEIIVIGIGQNGAMEVDEKTIKKFSARGGSALGRKNIEIIIAETPKAIGIYNDQAKLGKRVN